MKKLFLISSEEKLKTDIYEKIITYISTKYEVEVESKNYKDIILDYEDDTVFILYLSDYEIKLFIKNHLSSNQKIVILPSNDNIKAIEGYDISKDIYQSIDLAFNEKNFHQVDALLCNSQIVFSSVIIGDVYGLNEVSLENRSFIHKIKAFYKNLIKLKFKDFTFITAKEQTIHTSATGVMLLEHNFKKNKELLFDDDISPFDGKLNALILAPVSKLAYLYYLFTLFFLGKLTLKTLPESVGLIRSSKLDILSSKPIDFSLDGVLTSSKDIHLEIRKKCINIALNEKVVENIKNSNFIEDDKENVKVQNLPKDEMRNALISEQIPFFKKASEVEFKELFINLKESSNLSSIFLVLMVLSTLLASTGLFQDSAPVIIGAMILAPLMSPIVSLSMGVVRSDAYLIKNSARTLSIGIALALLFSAILTFFIPLTSLTTQMESRVNPNILDLIVAIISGIAGAYANSKSEIAKSLAGVAIAVALVPPLSVTGIAIGWGDFHMFYGSFLLFITNLVGITLASALTFIVLGYAPVLSRAKKGVIYTSIALFIVSIPLVLSFYKLIEQNKIIDSLNNKEYLVNNKKINLVIQHIDLNKKEPYLTVELTSSSVLNMGDFKVLKYKIEKELKTGVVLNISFKTLIK